MVGLRLIAVALSLLIHGSIGYAMLPSLQNTNSEALDLGKGNDIVLVEQGIATEGIAKLGDAMETIETPEIVPVQELPPPPPQDVKPDQLRDVISSEASRVEQQVVKAEEPPPVTPPPPAPDAAKQPPRPEQVAVVTEQSSGEEKRGGDAKAIGLYLGQINDHVQKAKVNPRARIQGTVLLRFTIGLDGQLLSKEVASSSGSKVLDDAATAALDRAAPFPPIPPQVSIKPLAFTQPFRFIVR